MPCNMSGFFDPQLTRNFGIVDFDWSNAKGHWANQHPMSCEEDLVTQVAMVKAVSPDTKVWVYRNLVKALPWYTNVHTRLSDPQYADWFLRFSGKDDYHVPACDSNYSPPLCSEHYHDNDQTPQHPHGDGSCTDPCDCGGVPCGEYLFSHTNASLRAYLVNEVVLGANGLGNPNISGMFFDDGWTDSPAPILPWEPKEGYCDHSPIGGPTEENFWCTADMGLTQADTTAISAAYGETLGLVARTVVAAGGFFWQGLTETSLPAPSAGVAACAAWFSRADELRGCAYMHEVYNATQRPLPAVSEDLAAFLIMRGPYAWLGYGWVGCITDYEFPDAWNADYGLPLGNPTSPAPGVFTREWSKATATFDCNAWKGTVTMKEA